MSDSPADVAKVAELIEDFRFAMVTTVNTLGELEIGRASCRERV